MDMQDTSADAQSIVTADSESDDTGASLIASDARSGAGTSDALSSNAISVTSGKDTASGDDGGLKSDNPASSSGAVAGATGMDTSATFMGSQQFATSDPISIPQGATVELSSAYSGLVTFAGNTGVLRLDDPASFSGTVAGMTGQDMIDFPTFDPAKVAQPTFVDPTRGQPPYLDLIKLQQPVYSAGGILSVTDGTQSANVPLLGNYLASGFMASSDGHGGTAVVDPPLAGLEDITAWKAAYLATLTS